MEIEVKTRKESDETTAQRQRLAEHKANRNKSLEREKR